MKTKAGRGVLPCGARCCPDGNGLKASSGGMNRRAFMERIGGMAAAGMALPRVSWASPAPDEESTVPGRRPLSVKPVLTFDLPQRKSQTSWRNWGGVQTPADVENEVNRIGRELKALESAADFPLRFLPVGRARTAADAAAMPDAASADVILVYAAGGWMDIFDALAGAGKDMIFFCRHKSGPVYLWYEIISPRYLRRHTDSLAVRGVTDADVVIDSPDEILWRLRSLCGLGNALGTRIIAVGGPAGWAQPEGVIPELVKNKWRYGIQTLDYGELGRLIKEARSDKAAVAESRRRAEAYLGAPGVSLETPREFVDNAFLLEQVFRTVMRQGDAQAITINGCMGTIMPLAETSACLTLSLLNDAGCLAFCESDFVVIPSGILLAKITGRPVFLNDPTYPHDGIITLAHCTAPRRMDGKRLEPARIMTHFESDYGAAPKVEMGRGRTVTSIIPDFASKRWAGLLGEIVDSPFMEICRSQIDIRFAADSRRLAERMPGFHWMTGYGDYMREVGYALRRVGIDWEEI